MSRMLSFSGPIQGMACSACCLLKWINEPFASLTYRSSLQDEAIFWYWILSFNFLLLFCMCFAFLPQTPHGKPSTFCVTSVCNYLPTWIMLLLVDFIFLWWITWNQMLPSPVFAGDIRARWYETFIYKISCIILPLIMDIAGAIVELLVFKLDYFAGLLAAVVSNISWIMFTPILDFSLWLSSVFTLKKAIPNIFGLASQKCAAWNKSWWKGFDQI